MIIKITCQNTTRHFEYDHKALSIVDTREKNLQVGKKKKVCVKPMNINAVIYIPLLLDKSSRERIFGKNYDEF